MEREGLPVRATKAVRDKQLFAIACYEEGISEEPVPEVTHKDAKQCAKMLKAYAMEK